MITDTQYRAAAKDAWHDEGIIEIDDTAEISHGEDGEGAYVQAWVWVSAGEAVTMREG